MKIPISLAFVVLLCQYAQGQEVAAQKPAWHSADKWLAEPTNRGQYHASVNYLICYDTVPCMYVSSSGRRRHKGFKVVYIKDGYYTDDVSTFGVFLDKRSQRIEDVRRYYFIL